MANIPATVSVSQAIYSGIAFPPRKTPGGGFFASDVNTNLIQDSIYTILSTKKGSMPMMPTFGSSAQDYLFENVSDVTLGLIADAIQADIELWEPRVTVLQIASTAIENAQVFQITCRMNANGQQFVQAMTFPTQ